MAKETGLVMLGEVVQNLWPGGYLVKIPELNMDIKAGLGWKMKLHRIGILPGDKVDVEISMYDTTQWRIIYRHSKDKPRPGMPLPWTPLPEEAPKTTTIPLTPDNTIKKAA